MHADPALRSVSPPAGRAPPGPVVEFVPGPCHIELTGPAAPPVPGRNIGPVGREVHVAAGCETLRSKPTWAVVFLISRSMDDPGFSTGKLTKLLYMADCVSYHENGSTVTGLTYLHFPSGPHPDGWHRFRRLMEEKGAVHVVYDRSLQGYHRYHMVPARGPDLQLLSPGDVAVLERQLAFFSRYGDAAMESYFRQESGWLSTEDGEPIVWELTGVLAPPATLRSVALNAGVTGR